MKKLAIILSLFLMTNTVLFAQGEKTDTIVQYKVGDKCYDFKFLDMEDKAFNLSELKGNYILIDIWSTWCPPCLKEMPHLQALEKRMHGKNIRFVSVSTERIKKRWKDTVKEKGFTGYQVQADGMPNISLSFNVTHIPRFILLDKKGRVLSTKMELRPSSGDEIYNYLMSLKGI